MGREAWLKRLCQRILVLLLILFIKEAFDLINLAFDRIDCLSLHCKLLPCLLQTLSGRQDLLLDYFSLFSALELEEC